MVISNPEEIKELFQNNALLDLALSLSLPVFSFNSHFLRVTVRENASSIIQSQS